MVPVFLADRHCYEPGYDKLCWVLVVQLYSIPTLNGPGFRSRSRNTSKLTRGFHVYVPFFLLQQVQLQMCLAPTHSCSPAARLTQGSSCTAYRTATTILYLSCWISSRALLSLPRSQSICLDEESSRDVLLATAARSKCCLMKLTCTATTAVVVVLLVILILFGVHWPSNLEYNASDLGCCCCYHLLLV